MRAGTIGFEAVALAAAAMACGDSAGSVLATQTISEAGGTIEVPSLSLTLTVPAGAVDENTTITISESSREAPTGVFGTVIHIEPEGVEFDPPLELTYQVTTSSLASDAYPERLGIVTYEDGEWTEVGNEIVDYDPATGSFSMMAYVEHFSDWAIRDSGLTQTLFGIGGMDVSNLTAAGEGGLVRYASGNTTAEATANETWFDYFTDGTTEYVVGVNSSRTPVLRSRPASGGTWSDATLPGTNAVLRGIHGDGSTVFAVGFLGRILSRNGSAWDNEIVTGAGHLFDVHGLGNGDAIAVGTGATVRIRTGGEWNPDEMQIPSNLATRLSLRGVWGTSTTDYYVVGSRGRDGVILHRTATGWAEERTETRRPFHGVSGQGTTTYFVGAGIFLRRNANGMYTSDNLIDDSCGAATQSVTLYDVFAGAGDDFVAVGSNGSIVNNIPCDTDAGVPMTMDGGTDAGAGIDSGAPPGSCVAMGRTLAPINSWGELDACLVEDGKEVASLTDFDVFICPEYDGAALPPSCPGSTGTSCSCYGGEGLICWSDQIAIVPTFSGCDMTRFTIQEAWGTDSNNYQVSAFDASMNAITLTATDVGVPPTDTEVGIYKTQYDLPTGTTPALILINSGGADTVLFEAW